jgi:glycosyltransferase involved in cell wall biosynthesis
MQIVIDASPLAAAPGGIRRYTGELIGGLARVDGEHRYVLRGAPRGWAPGREAALPCRFHSSPHRVRAERWLDQLRLRGVDGPIDLFHGTNYAAPLSGRIPIVITVHDMSVRLLPETHPRNRRLRHRLLSARLYRRAARLIADSHHTKRDLVRLEGIAPEKVDVVHLAAAEVFRRPAASRELETARLRQALPDRFLLYAGAIEPRKNLAVLLEAQRSLRREGRREPLLLAGSGAPRHVSALRARAQALGLEEPDAVRFLGPLGEEELAALYRLCTLFVYPSLYEGFGLPPLEAMSSGAPVVLSRTSSLAELYADSAILVDLEEPGSLGATLGRLLDDDAARAVLAEKGAKCAQRRSWDDVAVETLDVYRRAAEAAA